MIRSMMLCLFAVLVFVAALGIQGCDSMGMGRYDEGPYMSFVNADERVINTWEWAYALERNDNKTGDYYKQTIQFQKDGIVQWCDSAGVCRQGLWNLVTKKTRLQVTFSASEDVAYDILRLKQDEMWLVHVDTTNKQTRWEMKGVE